MSRMTFYLSISPEKYQRYYQGSAKFVHVQADDGRSLQFPASELQKFVAHNGIQGRFEIEFDEQYKLRNLRRLTRAS